MSLREFIKEVPVKPLVDTKECNDCKKHKPLSAFNKHPHHKDGFDNRCKDCKKYRNKEVLKLKKTAPPMPKACECCGELPNKGVGSNPRKRQLTLVLDHDKTTGLFRGWLCSMCNIAIGALGDDLNGVENALRYLQRHHAKHPSDKEGHT